MQKSMSGRAAKMLIKNDEESVSNFEVVDGFV